MPLFDLNAGGSKAIEELATRVRPEVIQHDGNVSEHERAEWPLIYKKKEKDKKNDKAFATAAIKKIVKQTLKAKHMEHVLKAVVEESHLTRCCAATYNRKDINGDVHLLSLKLFRFAWIKKSTRIRSTPNCQHQLTDKSEIVCVNPFHYEVVGQNRAALPPIHIGQIQPLDKDSDVMRRILGHCYQNHDTIAGYGPSNAFIRGDEMMEHIDGEVEGTSRQRPSDFFIPDSDAPTRSQFLHYPPEEAESPSSTHSHLIHSPNPQSPQSYLTDDNASPRNEDDMECDEELHHIANNIPDVGGMLSAVEQEDVSFDEPEHWVSFTYYERSRRVGPPVDARSPYVLVDGYTSPYNDNRICLGYFTNPQRDSGTSRTLLNIGRGARFYYLAGEVFVECLSNHPIYVQSPNCNQRHGWHAATVCQVPTGCNLKVFSYAEFASQLAECVNYGFDAVYALARLCTIRISFAKGWGCIYRRQNISSTPCWIEAHLNGALEWVDKVLGKMGHPNNVCTSFS